MTGIPTSSAALAGIEDEIERLAAVPGALSRRVVNSFERSLHRLFCRYGERATFKGLNGSKATIKIGVRTIRDSELAAGIPAGYSALIIPARSLRLGGVALPIRKGDRVVRFAGAEHDVAMVIDKEPQIFTLDDRMMLFRGYAQG
ncbi:MAG: hypothetical protein AAGB02_03135 [Pseudomonadota bacterium]